MQFKSRDFTVDLYGRKQIQMRVPSVKDRRKYLESIKDLDTESTEGLSELEEQLFYFLEGLGLPKDDALEMYDEDLQALVEKLLPSKKN
jgi:hypothetical protein